MATAYKRPCPISPCPEYQPCPKHKAQPRHGRDNKTAEERAFYDSPRWRRLALECKQEEPLCRNCAASGRVALAEISDHIVPLRMGGARWDKSNIQSLCRTCDQQKRNRESRGFLA